MVIIWSQLSFFGSYHIWISNQFIFQLLYNSQHLRLQFLVLFNDFILSIYLLKALISSFCVETKFLSFYTSGYASTIETDNALANHSDVFAITIDYEEEYPFFKVSNLFSYIYI